MSTYPTPAFQMRVASELFGTACVKTNEALLFVKAAKENGSSTEQALDDLSLIDDLLHTKTMYSALAYQVRYTTTGRLRKNSTLMHDLERVVDGHVQMQLEKKQLKNGIANIIGALLNK